MNMTQLKQGSLNGLRRQINECIDSAYNKGYEDGKKEPREVANVEDTSEYQIGYKAGLEDGKNYEDASYQRYYDKGYDKGYTQAIADYRKFERFFNSEGIEAFEDIRNTDGTISIDMILQYLPMPEIMARIKAYEEKKKADEIKEGDIVRFNKKSHVYNIQKDREFLVLHVFKDRNLATILYDNGDTSCVELSLVDKTSRHIDEVSQLLHKLRGEEE